MAPVGEAALTWASALDLLASKKTDDACKLGAEVQAKGNESGVKMVEASGAIVVAVAQLCKATGQPGSDFLEALRGLGATWSEAAALLATGEAGSAEGAWGKAAALAKALSGKASGEAGKALATATELAKEVGATWTDKLSPVTASDLSSSAPQDESTLAAAAAAPEAITDSQQKAAALVKAAMAQLQMENPQSEDALRNAKEALALFRELNVPEGEATALRAVSVTSLGTDAFGALQAANQALKTFKEIGHGKGQAAAIHAIAQAHRGKHSLDDCVFRAGEALKLSRQVGDRMREVAVLMTLVEANLAQGSGKRALSAAQDGLAVARSLGEKLLEARALCLVAQAQGACGEEGADAGMTAAQEALAAYQGLGLKSKESEALDALAAACRGKRNSVEALRCGQQLVDKFRRAGDKKEEAACLFSIANIHYQDGDDRALRSAQEALGSFQAAKDRKGEAKTLQLMAQIRLSKEEPGEALRAAEQACILYRNQAFPSRESRDAEIACIRMQVDANVAMGGIDEAMRLAGEQQRRFKSLREKKGEAYALLSLGTIHQRQGDTDDALNALVQAPALFLAVGDRKGEGEAWQMIAKIHLNKGDAQQAQRAAEESALAFRKLGDKKGRADAAMLVADVHFALASIGLGNPQEALKAAQEAVSLHQEMGDKTQEALSLHLMANANLMSRNFEDGLKAGQDAEAAFRALRNPGGEAAALLLQSGAHLGLKDWEQCRRCATECKDLFKSAGDYAGEDSVEDFLDNVDKYEKGGQNLDNFRGFSMRQADRNTGGKGDNKRQSRAPRKPRQMSNVTDIELIKAEPNKDSSKLTLAFFDGFEARAAGGGRGTNQKAKEDAAFSKGFEEGVDKNGYPAKEQVLYTVRWVQAKENKSSSSPGPKKGRREFTREDDKRVVSTGQLGAPKENWGSRYAQSSRLEPASGARGI